jgi:predicted transcriptional regulator
MSIKLPWLLLLVILKCNKPRILRRRVRFRVRSRRIYNSCRKKVYKRVKPRLNLSLSEIVSSRRLRLERPLSMISFNSSTMSCRFKTSNPS